MYNLIRIRAGDEWKTEDVADRAFQTLKQAFTTAPILKHPDPKEPFVVKVDASDTSVGAVLSQRFVKGQKMHPIVFFPKKLTSVERNYDVSN